MLVSVELAVMKCPILIAGTQHETINFDNHESLEIMEYFFLYFVGIHWHTLHTLDYQEYTHPKRDYIRLPLSARTGSTRIRWWQPLNSGSFTTSPSWALDNVYIGGSEINPSYLWLNFTQGMNEMNSNWEFSPKGKVQQEFCYKTEESLRWHEDSGEKSLTTNQLIIQENSILQFKVRLTELLIAEESFFLAFKFMH